MGGARKPLAMLLLGAAVVGWSAGRATTAPVRPAPAAPREPDPEPEPAPAPTVAARRRRRLVRTRPLAVAACALFMLTSSAFPLGPSDAAAPLTDPLVLARERRDNARRAETARLDVLASPQEAGIAGRRVSPPG